MVGTRLVEFVTPSWEKSYGELVQYKEEHGDCNVPFSYKENPSLGAWVNSQRTKWKNGQLDPKRKKLLADLGFDLVTTVGRMATVKGTMKSIKKTTQLKKAKGKMKSVKKTAQPKIRKKPFPKK